MTNIDHSNEKDRAELASEAGFTGTFTEMIEWLNASLCYGKVVVHELAPDQFGHPKVKVETVTGGFSDDEHLLGRLERTPHMAMSWISSHRGGLTVYEFPEWLVNDVEPTVWLEPDTGVFEHYHRVRTVQVYNELGDLVEFSYDAGAELAFEEPERDIVDPAGVLIVRPMPQEKRIEL